MRGTRRRGRALQRPATGGLLSLRLGRCHLRQQGPPGRTRGLINSGGLIAVGVNGKTGEREVLGFEVGPSEDGAFWTAFLRSLVGRGLWGVKLLTSDAHRGLKGAVQTVLQRTSWQRCRVHFMRNALSLVPKAAQQMVGATI